MSPIFAANLPAKPSLSDAATSSNCSLALGGLDPGIALSAHTCVRL